MRARLLLALAAILAAALLAAGCGGKSNEDQIRDSVDAVAAAGARGDYATVCRYATPQLLATYGGPAGCATLVAGVVQRSGFDFRALHLASVTVLAGAAKLDFDRPYPFQVAAQKVNGKWLAAGV